MPQTLKLALIHPQIVHGSLEDNQALLLKLNRKAANLGAQIILNTEMGLSGYGFDSRAEIAPLVQELNGPAVAPFARIAAEHRTYLALGWAERDPRTTLYYNSLVLLGPEGKPVAHRRKITAESKWACPGPARQQDMVLTPWGNVGLMICSETYFSLLPRTLALKGADLILVAANWPPGGLDPCWLWRGRALENGVYLAACNRTGQDKRMDMSQARSCCFDPQGRDLIAQGEAEPGIFMIELPLQDGRLALAHERTKRMAARKPGCYHYIGANLNRIKDLTSFLTLPQPGLLEVYALGGSTKQGLSPDELEARLGDLPPASHRLAVLPALDRNRVGLEQLSPLAERLDIHLAAQLTATDEKDYITLCSPGQEPRSWRLPSSGVMEPPMAEVGPARVGLAPARDLLHPELALAMAKRGCDLVAASGGRLSQEDQAVLCMRNLERVAVALAFAGGGSICSPPEGHASGPRLEVRGAGKCHITLDTALLRGKPYEEQIDYDLLLEPQAGAAS